MTPIFTHPAREGARAARRAAVAMILSTALAVTVAHAEAGTGGALPAPTPTGTPARSPMVQEMQDAVERARARVAQLGKNRLRAVSMRERAEADRSAHAAKLELEVELLRIQATWARREGRAEVAKRLESAIEALLAPPTLGDPARPVPRRADGSATTR